LCSGSQGGSVKPWGELAGTLNGGSSGEKAGESIGGGEETTCAKGGKGTLEEAIGGLAISGVGAGLSGKEPIGLKSTTESFLLAVFFLPFVTMAMTFMLVR